MPRRLAALAPGLLLALTGCADTLQGEVVEKHVDPGYTFIYQQPITTTSCSRSGQSTICRTTTTGYMPIVYYVPTCYSITVQGPESGDTCLDESKWNTVNVGDDYVGEDVDPKDRKVKRGEADH